MRRRRDESLIESITIEGFKSIAKQTLPLGRLNVVIGANGSGKTNLLEAAGVLGATWAIRSSSIRWALAGEGWPMPWLRSFGRRVGSVR